MSPAISVGILSVAVLQVTPVTMVHTEPFLEMQQRIAVNNEFICYSLRAGQIRVLHKHVSARSLLKKASHPPAVK